MGSRSTRAGIESTGAPLRIADPATYYGGGDTGYIDYVAHQH